MALFTELNPVYVSLNLGRTVSPFWDESLSQESFKLIRREGVYLGDTYLMVNFLKSEEPFMLRVIALEPATNVQYNFEMTGEDMMMMLEGNARVMEEEHLLQAEGCQLIINNLTMIRRGKAEAVNP